MWYYSNETDESSILCGTDIFLVKKNSKRHLWTPDPQLYNFKLWSSPTLIYHPHKATFTDRSSQSEPIANVDGKRQTTGIFCDNISSEFCLFTWFTLVQLIGAILVKFQESFHITRSQNHLVQYKYCHWVLSQDNFPFSC